MSNHYHLVVKLNSHESPTWSDDEIIHRWLSVFRGPPIIQKHIKGEALYSEETQIISEIVEKWRSRLSDLSWFMLLLNEPIARQENKEDKCTGHFWESRFKSDPLLTQEALLTCMANTPEGSDCTSIQERIKPRFDLANGIHKNSDINTFHFSWFSLKNLASFDGNIISRSQEGIPFSFKDYLMLVDTTGRIQRDDKRGFIPSTFAPILNRLNINQVEWLENTNFF